MGSRGGFGVKLKANGGGEGISGGVTEGKRGRVGFSWGGEGNGGKLGIVWGLGGGEMGSCGGFLEGKRGESESMLFFGGKPWGIGVLRWFGGESEENWGHVVILG